MTMTKKETPIDILRRVIGNTTTWHGKAPTASTDDAKQAYDDRYAYEYEDDEIAFTT